MRALWSDRLFARFWSAGMFFMLATWSLHVTMLVHVYELTGSPFATGLIPVFASLPGIILGPIAGAFVDRWDRGRVMATAALVLAVFLLVLTPVAALLGAGWGVTLPFAIIVVEAVVGTFFRPAENAVIPRLAGLDRLPAANALNALNDNIGRIAGPGIGSVLLVQVGFAATLAACAVLFAVAWFLLAGLRVPILPREDRPLPGVAARAGAHQDAVGPRALVTSIRRDLADGFRLVRAVPVLALTVGAWGLYMVADVPLSAVLPAFIIGSLGVGATGMGVSMPFRGVTGLLGGLFVASIAHRVSEVRLLAAGLLVYGISIVVMGASDSFVVSMLVLLPIGPAAAAIETGLLTLLQRASPDAMRWRVFGLVGMTNGVITIGASASGGALAEVIGTPTVVVLSGCLHLLPLILVVVWLRPAMRRYALRLAI